MAWIIRCFCRKKHILLWDHDAAPTARTCSKLCVTESDVRLAASFLLTRFGTSHLPLHAETCGFCRHYLHVGAFHRCTRRSNSLLPHPSAWMWQSEPAKLRNYVEAGPVPMLWMAALTTLVASGIAIGFPVTCRRRNAPVWRSRQQQTRGRYCLRLPWPGPAGALLERGCGE